MKTVVTVIGVIFVFGVIIGVVFPWAKDWASQTQGDIDHNFAKEVRSANIVAKAREEIVKEKDKLVDKKAQLSRAQDKLDGLQRECDKFKLELDGHEANLVAGLNALDVSTGDPVLVNGKSFSRAEVNGDVNKRTAACKKLRTQFEAASRNCQVLDAAIQEGGKKINEALATLDERAVDLDRIGVLLEAGDAMAAVKKFSESLSDVGVSGESNRYFEEIADRLAKVNVEIEFSATANSKAEFLDYGVNKPAAPINEAQEYRQKYLSAQAPAVSAPIPATDNPVVVVPVTQ